MNDAQLRAIVRDAVARHLGRSGAAGPVHASGPIVPPVAHQPQPAPVWQQHASHHLYVSLVNTDSACVIEPTVSCDHCGYCKSHGH